MLYWIFDLDYTLYDLPTNIKFEYELLNNDHQLNYLLQNLPSKKLLFTNGTFGHGIVSLKKMNIINNFEKIIARDTINDLKPNYSSFKLGGVQVRGKNAVMFSIIYLLLSLFINSIKLFWHLSISILWFTFLSLKWFFDFIIGFYKGFCNTNK